jgi:HAD superfamily hydrolase (TIGR01509 family)
MKAVTFDFGNTLADIDYDMLARRAGERGHFLNAARARAAAPSAWRVYSQAKRAGGEGQAVWCAFMRALLEAAGIPASSTRGLAEWLFTEQPRRNLWRTPIPGMIELCAELAQRGVPTGIISNSEGKLRELVAELGWLRWFRVVADSGRLGFEKPDARIFAWAAAELGVVPERMIHVGDAWVTDVEGATNAGACAIWFTGGGGAFEAHRALPDGVVECPHAAAVREALSSWGV